jgi:RNA polymerase sigma-70 factor (ECF subfamily)
MRPHSHDEDTELLARMKEGDRSALTLIYRKYWQRLYLHAFGLLKNAQACEDIIQELFLQLWTNRQQLQVKVSLNAYLFASVRYEMLRHIKAGRVNEGILEHMEEQMQAAPALEEIEYRELQSRVVAIIERLPEKCKEVYKLSREAQLSHKQIAHRLNISPKTVENHLTKALGFLRVSLSQLFTITLVMLCLTK